MVSKRWSSCWAWLKQNERVKKKGKKKIKINNKNLRVNMCPLNPRMVFAVSLHFLPLFRVERARISSQSNPAESQGHMSAFLIG